MNLNNSQIVKIGMRFSLKNRPYEVSFVDGANVRYSSCHGGRSHTLPTDTFWELVDDSVIGLLESEGKSPTAVPSDCRLWHLSDDERMEVARRFTYVRAVMEVHRHPLSRKNLKRVIAHASAENSDSSPPAASTLAGWMKKYVDSGSNIYALVPKHSSKGGRYKKIPLEVEVVILDSIRTDYLTTNAPSVQQLYCNIVGRMENSPVTGLADFQLNRRTVYRRVKAMDPYVLAVKRHGRRYADKRFRAAGASIEATRLMELVMIDGHRMDVFVIDKESGAELGRPNLVCLFDVRTRAVVGWHISLLPFCATTALAAIKDMCSRDPMLGPGGIAESIIPDNGPDLASDAVRKLCATLGMHIMPAKTYSPDDKAHLERLFRTLNQQLVHMLPGTTLSSPEKRGDYDSVKNAAITLDELTSLVRTWIEDVYHIHPHGATGRAPRLAWRDEQAALPIMFYPAADVDVIARIPHKRTISNGRVIVDYLAYKSDALATLEQRGMRQVTVYVDELNLGFVYVQHHSDSKMLIRADGVRTRYVKDLTKYEHDEVKGRMKAAEQKDLNEVGNHAYELARWQLWQDIRKLSKSRSPKSIKLLTQGHGGNAMAQEKQQAMSNAPVSSPAESGADMTRNEDPDLNRPNCKASEYVAPGADSDQEIDENVSSANENRARGKADPFDTFEI